MCEPVSITMGAIAVAGAVQGSMAAEDAEDAQYASNAANAQHRAGQYRRALSYQRKLAKWQKNVYDETAKSVRTSRRESRPMPRLRLYGRLQERQARRGTPLR